MITTRAPDGANKTLQKADAAIRIVAATIKDTEELRWWWWQSVANSNIVNCVACQTFWKARTQRFRFLRGLAGNLTAIRSGLCWLRTPVFSSGGIIFTSANKKWTQWSVQQNLPQVASESTRWSRSLRKSSSSLDRVPTFTGSRVERARCCCYISWFEFF